MYITRILATVAVIFSLATPLAAAQTTNTVDSQNIPTPPSTLSGIQTAVVNRADARRVVLQQLANKVSTMKYIEPADRQQLQTQISTTSSGLTALKSQIKQDKTVATATADYRKMYLDYRVYLLLAPKVNVLKVNDDLKAKTIQNIMIISMMDPYSNYISNQEVTEVRTIITHLNGDIDTINQIDSTVMPLQPADYNHNHQVMQASLNSLQTTKTSLDADYTQLTTIKNNIASRQSQTVQP